MNKIIIEAVFPNGQTVERIEWTDDRRVCDFLYHNNGSELGATIRSLFTKHGSAVGVVVHAE